MKQETAQKADVGRRPKLEDFAVPLDQYSYCFGYIGRSHTIAIERLDAILAKPGDKRTLLKTVAAIRDDLADDTENLRCHLERRAAIAAVKTGGAS